jgi:hypothetical protein
VPANITNINDATFLVPCIKDATPGVLPENWELPLHFIAPPTNMTALPVIEITPSPAPTSAGTGVVVQNPLSITKVIDAGDSYILIIEYNPPMSSQAVSWWEANIAKLSDANGQKIAYDFPSDIIQGGLTPEAPNAMPWTIKFSKGFAPPLHITYSGQPVFSAPPEKVEFEFDAGPNPQIDQTWHLNKEIKLGGHSLMLVSVAVAQQGYKFSYVTSDESIFNSMGNESGVDVSITVYYDKLPKGKLKIVLSNLWIFGETKDWTLEWQP